MFDIQTVPFPATYDGDQQRAEREAQSLKALETLLKDQPGEYAGVIIEPLVQGAAGMRMCSESFLQRLQAIVQETGTLLIYDEVMTGFGRTGDWFACTKSKTQPDIICLSKGITGGFLPLSVTICTDRIYDAFYADELEKAFFHSHSYTGNPIACAAGVASMKLLEKTKGVFKAWEARSRRLWHEYLEPLETTTRARFCGTIFAFDLDLPGDASYFNDRAPQLRAEFLKRGLLLRPLGHTVYMMPPYCTDDETLEGAVSTIRDVVSGIM